MLSAHDQLPRPLRAIFVDLDGTLADFHTELARLYLLDPAEITEERWAESQRLWQDYLDMGGSLDPEPDTQSPFFDEGEARSQPPDGRPGVRVVRRSRV